LVDVGSTVAHASFIEHTETPSSFEEGSLTERAVNQRKFAVRAVRKP